MSVARWLGWERGQIECEAAHQAQETGRAVAEVDRLHDRERSDVATAALEACRRER